MLLSLSLVLLIAVVVVVVVVDCVELKKFCSLNSINGGDDDNDCEISLLPSIVVVVFAFEGLLASSTFILYLANSYNASSNADMSGSHPPP